MMLKRWFVIGSTAATLFAQDFSQLDQVQMEAAVQAMKQAKVQQQVFANHDVFTEKAHMLAEKGLMAAFSADKMAATHALAMEKAAFAMQTLRAKGMGGDMAFSYQGPKRDGGFTEQEELKALAIDSLIRSDSERGIPAIDKVLQDQNASTRLRLHALQALGRSNSPKAREIVARVAKDGSNSELQSRALHLLGNREGAENKQLLSEVYASASSPDIKRQVLRTWMSTGAKDQILNVAKSEANLEVRKMAIRDLGRMKANTELASLYSSESSNEIRNQLLNALAGAEDWRKLLEIAKTEKDEDLRNRAIQYAASNRTEEVTQAIIELYGATSDASTRASILRALSHRGEPKHLIALARKETNGELKRTALQHLLRMKGDEVTSYLTELLDK